MAATQDNRSTAITTALGKDALLLHSFEYKETMNAPFEIWARVFSKENALSLDSLVGTPASIRINTSEGDKVRYLHGLVESVTQKGREPDYAVYELQLVPWLTFLDKTSDCRIFQKKKAPDIISEVFQKAGFTDFELKLTDSYPTREFCVQYRETSANFVARLMEHEGIGYHFKHEESKHTLVLTDAVSSHEPFPGYATVKFREAGKTADFIESLQTWDFVETGKTGKYAQTDYNFKTPKAGMLATEPQPKPHGLADFEQFDYPGIHEELGGGERLAKIRLQALQTGHKITRGFSASCRGLVIGRLFTLEDHPRGDQNAEHLITAVEIYAEEGSFTSSGNSGGGASFTCKIATIPSATPYRPALDERKLPIIPGPQTAVVTGPAGEEIHTDEHGRVTVHFHWDRYGKFDQDSSCWVRVSQTWAGKGWGAMHIPRIGQEVVVDFLEGNPDRPLITGRVYNADMKPPYPLPAKKNCSGLRSNTTLGGQPSVNFNEVMMDDTKGSELLSIQAEKDRTVLVKNDNTENVGHDETIDVGHDQTMTIGNDRKKHVKANETTNVDANRTEEVGKDETITIHGQRTEEVDKNETITIHGARAEEVDKDEKISIHGQRTEEVDKDETITVHANRTETVDKDEKVSIGKNRAHDVGQKDTLQVGKELTIDVGDKIVIRTGKASITMKKDGSIVIDGKDITFTASGKITGKATGDIILKGKKVLEN